MNAATWQQTRRFPRGAFANDVLARRGDTRIAVCLPARDEASTIARVLDPLIALRDQALVDRVVVADAGSTDETAVLAHDAGADVVSAQTIGADLGPVIGKGDTVWRSLTAIEEDVVVWFDSDLEAIGDDWVSALAGPLLVDAEIQLVKGNFHRPTGGPSVPYGGGRVTELTARPLLQTFYPELAILGQPLSGQVAARRDWVAQMPLYVGYGLEMGVLLETWSRGGLEAIAESDLGTLRNRHQALADLHPMAMEVLIAVTDRLTMDGRLGGVAGPDPAVGAATLRRPPLVSLAVAETAVGSHGDKGRRR